MSASVESLPVTPRVPAAAESVREPAAVVREGVLEVPGPVTLYHGGRLQELRIAWRLVGAAQGPVVCALGGISADRYVCLTDESHPGWWSEVVGPGAAVGLRSDATWSVPEPELVLVIDPGGRIVGYTIGNDMSSRDIEGQNPLYLPQAKIYNRSCAMGPGILVTREVLPDSTRISISIERGGAAAFAGETTLAQMKRKPQELVDYLYRDQTFPVGCFLFTGTGIVPPDSFTLERGDLIRIGIDGIGMLVNQVD